MQPCQSTGKIFAVGGGKGGVGKSIFAISLALQLVYKGYKVIIADLDLGAANIHTYLGVLRKTPTLADFILKRVSSLEDILVKTSVENLQLISGAEFFPGMANPAHWLKVKIMRHLKQLPVDFVIIDLGGGVNYNTLDFFNISEKGFIVTVPEPGAVLNAYLFIKSAFFRTIQNVFRNHQEINDLIQTELQKNEAEQSINIKWFAERVKEIDYEMHVVLKSIEESFQPVLVINRTNEDSTHVLVKNLLDLCNQQLGIQISHVSNLPDENRLSHYLLNLPAFFDTPEGKLFLDHLKSLWGKINIDFKNLRSNLNLRNDFLDEEIQEIINFIDSIDDTIFEGTNKNIWKFRMYYSPSDVLQFLVSKGISHDLFYSYRPNVLEHAPEPPDNIH